MTWPSKVVHTPNVLKPRSRDRRVISTTDTVMVAQRVSVAGQLLMQCKVQLVSRVRPMLGPCAEAQRGTYVHEFVSSGASPDQPPSNIPSDTVEPRREKQVARVPGSRPLERGEGREGGRADTDGRRHGRTELIGSNIRARWSEKYFRINAPKSEVRAATRNFSSEKTKTVTIQNYLSILSSPLSTLYLYLNMCISFSCSVWIIFNLETTMFLIVFDFSCTVFP